MIVLRFILGCILGAGVGFGTGYLLGDQVFQFDSSTSLIVAAVMGGIAGIYSAFALASRIYKLGFFSILGYIIDNTWSLLNSLAGLAVWIPAALITGAKFLSPTPDSRRSGTFVYDKNPRDPSGTVFLATTVGTVIAGKWSSHEEIHVWQARLYGPVYGLIYFLSFGLNCLALLPFRRNALMEDAYRRICFEEWAYWGGTTSGSVISWGGWIGGFFLTLLYCSLVLVIPIGFATQQTLLWIIGIGGLLVYSVVRALLPA